MNKQSKVVFLSLIGIFVIVSMGGMVSLLAQLQQRVGTLERSNASAAHPSSASVPNPSVATSLSAGSTTSTTSKDEYTYDTTCENSQTSITQTKGATEVLFATSTIAGPESCLEVLAVPYSARHEGQGKLILGWRGNFDESAVGRIAVFDLATHTLTNTNSQVSPDYQATPDGSKLFWAGDADADGEIRSLAFFDPDLMAVTSTVFLPKNLSYLATWSSDDFAGGWVPSLSITQDDQNPSLSVYAATSPLPTCSITLGYCILRQPLYSMRLFLDQGLDAVAHPFTNVDPKTAIFH